MDQETMRSSTAPTVGSPSRRSSIPERSRGTPPGTWTVSRTSRNIPEFHRLHARYAVQNVQETDCSTYENNPAAACFRLYRGDRADMLRRPGTGQAPSAGQASLFTPPSHDDRCVGSRMLSRAALERAPLISPTCGRSVVRAPDRSLVLCRQRLSFSPIERVAAAAHVDFARRTSMVRASGARWPRCGRTPL